MEVGVTMINTQKKDLYIWMSKFSGLTNMFFSLELTMLKNTNNNAILTNHTTHPNYRQNHEGSRP